MDTRAQGQVRAKREPKGTVWQVIAPCSFFRAPCVWVLFWMAELISKLSMAK